MEPITEFKFTFDEQYVDAAAMRLIKDPDKYDTIVTTNVFGDILSDEAAQLVGGLGMAPGANVGDDFGLFEPIHGTAPTRVGKHTANPCSMILAAKMMLDWLGENEKAQMVDRAVGQVISEGKIRTYDMGGSNSTLEMADEIASKI